MVQLNGEIWNFPNRVGAIDGKHVTIQCLEIGGSMCFNYKMFHDIVLLAVLNVRYKFSMVDIGDYGKLSDNSVYANCNLERAINQNLLQLPSARKLFTNISKKYLAFL